MRSEVDSLEVLARRIRILCGNPKIAERHLLTGLYHYGTNSDCGVNRAPIGTVAWQLSLRAHWARVSWAFGNASLPVALLKGLRWSDGLFPSSWLRPTGDLDILVRQENLAASTELLEQIGARPYIEKMSRSRALEEHYHLLFRFEDSTPPVFVELHWRIAPPEYVRLSDQELWTNIEVTPGGYMLNRELDLLLACLHAYRHGYSPFRTLVDVERMVVLRGQDICWDRFWELTKRAGATYVVAFVLYLSSRHLAFVLPLGADRRKPLLRVWFSVASLPLSSHNLLYHPRYSAVYRLITATVTGTWPTVGKRIGEILSPHPEALAKIYDIDPTDRFQICGAYLLRPLRLLRKYLTPAQKH